VSKYADQLEIERPPEWPWLLAETLITDGLREAKRREERGPVGEILHLGLRESAAYAAAKTQEIEAVVKEIMRIGQKELLAAIENAFATGDSTNLRGACGRLVELAGRLHAWEGAFHNVKFHRGVADILDRFSMLGRELAGRLEKLAAVLGDVGRKGPPSPGEIEPLFDAPPWLWDLNHEVNQRTRIYRIRNALLWILVIGLLVWFVAW
jgi:hypothetical protein